MGAYVNSKQTQFDKSFVSCGVVEVHHLPDAPPSEIAFSIANHLYHKANGRPAAFLLFSDVVDKKEARGKDLADYLRNLNVGKLIESVKAVNPKTGNTIRVWLLEVCHESFRKWYSEEYVNRISEN